MLVLWQVSYIHRIGRTGRAGRAGEAVTFFTEQDRTILRTIAEVIIIHKKFQYPILSYPRL